MAYTIAEGDTLGSIAAKNNTTVDALAKNNNITDPNKITAGQILNIPGNLAPVASSPSAISVSKINQPVNAPVIPPVNNTTAQNALGVTANGVATAAANPVVPPPVTAAPVTDIKDVTGSASLASYLKTLIGQQAGKGDFIAQQQDDQQLTQKMQALTDINNEALTTKKSYEDQIKSLQDNNPEGKFGGGLGIAVNDLTRKSNEDLANIGIRQLVAQNNVEGAQKIIDTKVAAKFEPIQNEIDSLTKLYSVYQNDMSESEKLAAQSALDDKKTKAANLSNAYSAALKEAVSNNAPQSVLSAIDTAASNKDATEASIYSALGSYGVNSTDQAIKAATLKKLQIENSKGGNSSPLIAVQDGKGNPVAVPTNVAPYFNTSNSGVGYIDASSLQGTAAEKTQIINDAQKAGLKVITNKNTAADLVNIKDANEKLDTIGTIMAGIDQPNALSRTLGGILGTKAATLFQTDPQKAASGALQSVGLDILKAVSGVQGFRGNASVIQQVTDHLPKITDTSAVVNQKIDYIRQLINARENSIVGKATTSADPLNLGITVTKDPKVVNPLGI